MAWVEDHRKNKDEHPVIVEHFNEHRSIYIPGPEERLEIAADLRAVGTPDLRQRWSAYDEQAELLRVAFIWATEDEGAEAERVVPDLADATEALLESLTDTLT